LAAAEDGVFAWVVTVLSSAVVPAVPESGDGVTALEEGITSLPCALLWNLAPMTTTSATHNAEQPAITSILLCLSLKFLKTFIDDTLLAYVEFVVSFYNFHPIPIPFKSPEKIEKIRISGYIRLRF